MKIKNIFLVLISLFAFSCTDLDLTPLGETTPEVLFQDESAYKAFIARVYSGIAVTGQQGPSGNSDILSLDEGFSNYLRQYWQAQELPTESAVIGWGDEGIQDLHNHVWTDANQFLRAIYYRIFYQVSIANEFLRETTNEKLDGRNVSSATRDEIKTYRAEARFLRALSYWHGMDLFGNIPFYTESSAIGSDAPDQAGSTEVFNFLENELSELAADLPAPGQAEYGRADQATVWMLQAKLFLNAMTYSNSDRYSDCIAACNNIINSGVYTLMDNYGDNFIADNHTSTEVIFPITFDGERTQTWGGTTYLVHAPIGGTMNDVSAEVFGVNGGWFGLRTTKNLPNLFPDVTGEIDERGYFWTDGQKIEVTSIGEFDSGYGVPKYTNVNSDGTPGSDLTHPDTDFPMFRLPDAYLMYAEAVLRGGSGGDIGTAVNYINIMRERAYNGTGGNLSAGDLTLDFILDERSRELYWEGHRRTDLIRYNSFSDNGVWPWKGGVPEGQTTDAFRNLFPIPAAEILANPKLTQNPGY